MVNIKEWRQEFGITQKALADASGLDIRWIQKVEAGDIDIRNVTVKRFAFLIKGISELSQKSSCSGKMKKELDAVKGVHETVGKLFREGLL